MADTNADSAQPSREEWMAYIHKEMAAVCAQRGWRQQLRRAWECREKPVATSGIEDYEWKIVVAGRTDLDDAGDHDLDRFYVLRLDPVNRTFRLLHDNDTSWGTDLPRLFFDRRHCTTSTELPITFKAGLPPAGTLATAILELTERFNPNFFSTS